MSATYESVILFGVLFFFHYGFSSITQLTGAPSTLRNVGQVFLFIVLAVYFVWFWSDAKRTLPMKTMALMVVDYSGNPITRGRALARYCAAVGCALAMLALVKLGHMLILFLLLPLPFAVCFFQKDKQTLYDLIARTRLVEKPVSAAEKKTNPVGQ